MKNQRPMTFEQVNREFPSAMVRFDTNCLRIQDCESLRFFTAHKNHKYTKDTPRSGPHLYASVLANELPVAAQWRYFGIRERELKNPKPVQVGGISLGRISTWHTREENFENSMKTLRVIYKWHPIVEVWVSSTFSIPSTPRREPRKYATECDLRGLEATEQPL